MYTFLFVLFLILSFFLALFVLIQQGKGDLGASALSGSQMLFGGSGGQNFFERATWIMGLMFMVGALGLAVLKSKENTASILDGAVAPRTAQHALPSKATQPLDQHNSSAPQA